MPASTVSSSIDKVIQIDQSPIGRTPRSNPATYTGLFTFIRELFAMLPEARARGFKPGRFSFNVKGGRCEACQGDGVIAIEMHFLPDVYVTCEQCKGRRYNRETLDIKYRGKSIAEVLELTVDQALPLLENFPPIAVKLRTLQDVGLGYIKLGQSATTLSGGEAQRVKLSKELSRRGTGRTLYILDEPTTGLHFEDTRKLLDVLNKLVDQGNTVLVIEHNLDVIKSADYLIDLGPEGGEAGGRVVPVGTPEDVARCHASHTGRCLAEVLGTAGPAAGYRPKVAQSQGQVGARHASPVAHAWRRESRLWLSSHAGAGVRLWSNSHTDGTPCNPAPALLTNPCKQRYLPLASARVHLAVSLLLNASGGRSIEGHFERLMDLQRTLRRPKPCAGIGLHSGRKATLSLKPAAANTGIRFRRTDIDGLEIPATVQHLASIHYATALGGAAGSVETVEHLLAALVSLGIDNVIVELDCAEVPIMDGSAAPFVYLIQEAGVKSLPAPEALLEGDPADYAVLRRQADCPLSVRSLQGHLQHQLRSSAAAPSDALDARDGRHLHRADCAGAHVWLHEGSRDAAPARPRAGRLARQCDRAG